MAHAVSSEHALKHRIVAGGAIDLEVGASLAGLIEGLEVDGVTDVGEQSGSED